MPSMSPPFVLGCSRRRDAIVSSDSPGASVCDPAATETNADPALGGAAPHTIANAHPLATAVGARMSTVSGAGADPTRVAQTRSHVTARRTVETAGFVADGVNAVVNAARDASSFSASKRCSYFRPPTIETRHSASRSALGCLLTPPRPSAGGAGIGAGLAHVHAASPASATMGTSSSDSDARGSARVTRSATPATSTPSAAMRPFSYRSAYAQSQGSAVRRVTGACAVSRHADSRAGDGLACSEDRWSSFVRARTSSFDAPANETSSSRSATKIAKSRRLDATSPSDSPSSSGANAASHGPSAFRTASTRPNAPAGIGHSSSPRATSSPPPASASRDHRETRGRF